MPAPVVRLVEVAELRLTAEGAGIASISREEGWMVFRFGAAMSRATAMRLLSGGGLPGVRPADIVFASNQVRIRVPRPPATPWSLIASRDRAPDRRGGGRRGPRLGPLSHAALDSPKPPPIAR